MRDFRWSMPPYSLQAAQSVIPEEEGMDWGDREWGTHRYHIRQLLEEAVSRLAAPERAAVLGAGNHGHVSLPGLARRFQQVTAIDTDANGIAEWAEQSGPGLAGRVKSLVHTDYTRLDQIHFYETFEELLQRHAPAKEIADYLQQCMYRVIRYEALPHLKRTFSLTVISGVYTQLFYVDALSRLATYADAYESEGIRQITEALGALRNQLVVDLNKLAVSLVQPGGCIALWTEVVLMDERLEAEADKLYMLKDEAERTRALFRLFGQYGLEAATIGLKDMNDRLVPGTASFKSWLWRTDGGKTYLAAGLSGTPRA